MLCDWWAVTNDRTEVEAAAKPLVMVGLIATVAASAGAASAVAPLWLTVAALAFGLLGDVFLLPPIDRFIPGLASFLVGHLFYIAAFIALISHTEPAGFSPVGLAAGAVVGILLMASVGRLILTSVRATRLAAPVGLYVTAIAALIVIAASTGRWWIGIGAVVFASSDALLGHDRFVTPRTDRRVVVHISYHLGQAAIVYGVLTN